MKAITKTQNEKHSYYFQIYVDEDNIEALDKKLSQVTGKSIAISFDANGKQNYSILCSALNKYTTFEKIKLFCTYKQLGSNEGRLLAQSLSAYSQLIVVRLHMYGNKITDTGASEIFNAISDKQSLQYLEINLRNNLIQGTRGFFDSLKRALESLDELQEVDLDLSQNPMKKCVSFNLLVLPYLVKERTKQIALSLSDTAIPAKVFQESFLLLIAAQNSPRSTVSLNLSGTRKLLKPTCLKIAETINNHSRESELKNNIVNNWVVDLSDVIFTDIISFINLTLAFISHRCRTPSMQYNLTLSPLVQKKQIFRDTIQTYEQFTHDFYREILFLRAFELKVATSLTYCHKRTITDFYF